MTRVPAIEHFTTGMCSASSASNTELKFSLVPCATKQYEFVRVAKQPISLEFSKTRRVAMLLSESSGSSKTMGLPNVGEGMLQ